MASFRNGFIVLAGLTLWGCSSPSDASTPAVQCGPLPTDSHVSERQRHYVSHVMHEHTSITRLIETVFGIPAMTARDANSDALLDMFDFSCKTPAAIPEASAAGTGGCQ